MTHITGKLLEGVDVAAQEMGQIGAGVSQLP
jgi:hypothetical protein